MRSSLLNFQCLFQKHVGARNTPIHLQSVTKSFLHLLSLLKSSTDPVLISANFWIPKVVCSVTDFSADTAGASSSTKLTLFGSLNVKHDWVTFVICLSKYDLQACSSFTLRLNSGLLEASTDWVISCVKKRKKVEHLKHMHVFTM